MVLYFRISPRSEYNPDPRDWYCATKNIRRDPVNTSPNDAVQNLEHQRQDNVYNISKTDIQKN